MARVFWVGIALIIYGIVVLIGAIVACPAKHASISVAIYMVLTGIAFTILLTRSTLLILSHENRDLTINKYCLE